MGNCGSVRRGARAPRSGHRPDGERDADPAGGRRSALSAPGRGAAPWAVALLAIVAAGLAWRGRTTEHRPHPVARFSILLPRGAEPLGAVGSTIAFAPDGSQVVYVGRGGPSGQRLYVRRMDRPDPVAVPGSDGGSLPFFSSDSRWLGFAQGTKLVKVAVAGGPVIPVCTTPGIVRGATWTPGDTIIFSADSGLMDVSAAGGTPRVIARPDSTEVFRFPEVLPGARAVLFGVSGQGRLELAALIRRTGEVKRLKQAGGYPRWVDAGFVVVSDPSGIVSAVPFDPERLTITGSALPIVDQLVSGADGDLNLGVSRSGDLAYDASATGTLNLVVVDRAGVVRDTGSAPGYYYAPTLSPDGRRLAVQRSETFDFSRPDIWIHDLVQGTRTRLTFDTSGTFPVWSPDGRHVAYTRWPSGLGVVPGVVAMVPADGSGPPRTLPLQNGQWAAMAFESGGTRLIYNGRLRQEGRQAIWRVALDSGATPELVVQTGFDNAGASLAPDGKWLAYVTNETGRDEVYVRPYPGPGGRWQVSLDGGREPLWTGTGNEIIYRVADRVLSAAVRTRPGFEVTGRSTLFTGDYLSDNFRDHNYAVSSDGRTFVMVRSAASTNQSVTVMLNWFDHVGARR